MEGNWACLVVKGILDFSLTGIIAGLTAPLAQAGISIFAMSTFDTDYLMVSRHKLAEALQLLTAVGCTIDQAEP